ncbi:MAG: NYN domain-containing protein [Candidatus Humimicrobiaceae bacterium]
MRTYIYIDGFNFYYLAVKNTNYKWLDFKSLFVKLLASYHKISAIKYYTATVSGINDPQQPIRQQSYLNALQAYIPEFSVYYGSFLSSKKWMPLVTPINNTKFVQVTKTEEKGSDVNLSVHLVNDAWKNLYDCAVIVSNDSDLYEAIRIVKEELNKKIGLIILPNGNPSIKLLSCTNFKKAIRNNLLKNSQLPDPIPNTNIYKPTSW